MAKDRLTEMGDGQALPALVVVGDGRLGGALRLRAEAVGWPVAGVWGRAGGGEEIPAGALVMLCVPDDVIEAVCAGLPVGPGQVVAHSSGMHGSGRLVSAREAGAAVGSWHPLQTFPDPVRGAECFADCACFVEGDPEAVAVLRVFGKALGARVSEIPADMKVLYHAAAVMACNHLVALADAARAIGEEAGMVDPLVALRPLMEATLTNVIALGPEAALTGPVARGDADTVAAHLQALDGELLEMYRVLARRTLGVARRAGLDERLSMGVSALLDGGGEKD